MKVNRISEFYTENNVKVCVVERDEDTGAYTLRFGPQYAAYTEGDKDDVLTCIATAFEELSRRNVLAKETEG